MKIFFDHKIFIHQKYGGPSRYFVNLVNELNTIDSINAKIFAPLHINNFLNSLDKSNIGFAKKILFNDKISTSPKLKKKLMDMNNYINLYFFKKFNSDILHTTYYDYNKNYIRNKKKIIITVFDLIHEIYKKEYNFSDNYFPKKEILDIADHIICISNSTKFDLVKFYKITENKISVTYLATDYKLSNFERKINEKYFLYVGSRWKYKNFSTLLEVIGHNKDLLQNFKLVIFGGGALSKEEMELINKYKIDKTKILHLNGDDALLKSLYRNAEFFIYPTKYEGFGIPLLESFSQNCPVLCSNLSSLKEVGGNAPTYFDPKDIKSINNAIEKIISNIEYKNECVKKGLIRLEEFSWKKCATETLNVYKKIL